MEGASRRRLILLAPHHPLTEHRRSPPPGHWIAILSAGPESNESAGPSSEDSRTTGRSGRTSRTKDPRPAYNRVAGLVKSSSSVVDPSPDDGYRSSMRGGGGIDSSRHLKRPAPGRVVHHSRRRPVQHQTLKPQMVEPSLDGAERNRFELRTCHLELRAKRFRGPQQAPTGATSNAQTSNGRTEP